jgi:hypothetical protein
MNAHHRLLRGKRATAPRAAAPHTTAPQATAPQATVPHATAPQATAPHAAARFAVALLAAALLAIALGLAACGSAASSGSRTPAPSASPATALERELDHLDRLVVVRSDAFPQNHLGFSFPEKVTVGDPVEVRTVARALLALPAMPATVLNAPIDLGITYRLTFATPNGSLPAISIAATGAQTVRGLGTTRWLARSPGFWNTLGSAMGLARPDYATFRGAPTSG